jgi:hypothetical protein
MEQHLVRFLCISLGAIGSPRAGALLAGGAQTRRFVISGLKAAALSGALE